MSQGQPRRPVDQPIKYGDVFSVEGEMAEKAVAPGDAAVMQSAESLMLGQRAPLVPPPIVQGDGITIGEALEAAGITAGHKPVERSDAAAIQAAEVRATGRTDVVPGGVAAVAQSAATHNAQTPRREDKTKLRDVLADASSKLPSDRPATMRDAKGVTSAETRNDSNLTTHPTGVAASVAVAARLNEKGDKAP
ncbi:hypothetical protein TIFTF001_000894 [Ficus carica]|uniref:SMP domain-containing protein n=1 Tax=Ficus carica TaxID=3494 RepID=A0AA87YWR1_FICCA|nr:hypothetical protein TIFTF001_000894 [Ficus carica]